MHGAAPSGRRLWIRRFRFSTYRMRRSLAVAGKIFAGDDNAGLYSVNRRNGNLFWYVHHPLKHSVPTEAEYSGPIVANGVPFDGGIYQRGVYAYEASSARILWSFGQRTASFDASPVCGRCGPVCRFPRRKAVLVWP